MHVTLCVYACMLCMRAMHACTLCMNVIYVRFSMYVYAYTCIRVCMSVMSFCHSIYVFYVSMLFMYVLFACNDCL